MHSPDTQNGLAVRHRPQQLQEAARGTPASTQVERAGGSVSFSTAWLVDHLSSRTRFCTLRPVGLTFPIPQATCKFGFRGLVV